MLIPIFKSMVQSMKHFGMRVYFIFEVWGCGQAQVAQRILLEWVCPASL